MEKLPTHCKALDQLTDGGLPTGTITQVFGEKALGKSILCFQAACATVASGRTAVVLDTEQSYMSYLVEYRLGLPEEEGDLEERACLPTERHTHEGRHRILRAPPLVRGRHPLC